MYFFKLQRHLYLLNSSHYFRFLYIYVNFARLDFRGSASHLQQLRVLPTDLLQESWEQRGVLLDQLPHDVELRLVSEEAQRIS